MWNDTLDTEAVMGGVSSGAWRVDPVQKITDSGMDGQWRDGL